MISVSRTLDMMVLKEFLTETELPPCSCVSQLMR